MRPEDQEAWQMTPHEFETQKKLRKSARQTATEEKTERQHEAIGTGFPVGAAYSMIEKLADLSPLEGDHRHYVAAAVQASQPVPEEILDYYPDLRKADPDLSARLARHAIPRQCYNNAISAWVHVPGGTYVEGYVVERSTGFHTDHGWLENAAGETVDPTNGAEVVNWAYFPAFRYRDMDELLAMLEDNERLPAYEARLGLGAINRSPEVQRAYAQALIFADEHTPGNVSGDLRRMADRLLAGEGFKK